MDINDVAYHAGSRTWNNNSIGVEISNAYYPKHQSWYVKQGLGERPIIDDAIVHGKRLKPFMGFYPQDRSKKTNTTVSKKAASGKFEGFVSHYHLTNRKIDCAGLDLKELLKEI